MTRLVEAARLVIPPDPRTREEAAADPFPQRLVLLVAERQGVYTVWTTTREILN